MKDARAHFSLALIERQIMQNVSFVVVYNE